MMANAREVRGWAVVALGGAIGFSAFAARLWAIFETPIWLIPVDETLLVVAFIGVAIGAVGLHRALWYLLVRADGVSMYAASVLLLAPGTLHLFEIPGQTNADFMLVLFMAAILEWMVIPLLSYRSRVLRGAVAAIVLVIVLLTSGFAFLPPPFDAAVNPWSWSPLLARILELAAVGAIGNMLVVAKHVPPASERAGRPA